MNYSIFDPTGNITALVEDAVEVSLQPAVASKFMQKHPEVEQVGFFSVESDPPALRMAGGEFCGNASMSAAALRCLRLGLSAPNTVCISVSGAEKPVEVSLTAQEGETFSASVRMPRARMISVLDFTLDSRSGTLPVVWMQGICHIVIEPDSAFFPLREAPETAERAVRLWCRELKADGLGLMFLDRSSLTPLVFVPGCDSVFWERSCASGTAAAGMYLASKTGREVDLALAEPGGILRVESSVRTGETRLYGSTRRMQTISE